jgi:metal-sulfur cluster biosynthetic enzyme
VVPVRQASEQSAVSNAVLDALRVVVEPHLGVNVVDLGLVYEVHADGAGVRVALGMLTPYEAEDQDLLARVVRAIEMRLPQFEHVELHLVRDRVWHPGRMSEETRRRLGI